MIASGHFRFAPVVANQSRGQDVRKKRENRLPADHTAAHKEGFIHRDIKPHSIFLHRNHAKISDFGLAKNFQKAGLSGMSITGQYAGTPVFMPPEQITNFKYAKPVSDVWSFAASLYQLLTGKFPYRFDPKRDPIDIILNENPVPIRDRMPGLEKTLAATIDKALVRNPKARAPSSALRPSQASAAELVAGGCQIAISTKQPLGELTQVPVAEYALSASPAQIDSEESSLLEWAAKNHRIFPPKEVAGFEQQAGPQGGVSEHDAWVVMGKVGKVVIRQKNGTMIPIDVFFEGLPAAPS